MEIKRIDYDFSVCKVVDDSLVDLNAEYSFVGTDYVLTKKENYQKALDIGYTPLRR